MGGQGLWHMNKWVTSSDVDMCSGDSKMLASTTSAETVTLVSFSADRLYGSGENREARLVLYGL